MHKNSGYEAAPLSNVQWWTTWVLRASMAAVLLCLLALRYHHGDSCWVWVAAAGAVGPFVFGASVIRPVTRSMWRHYYESIGIRGTILSAAGARLHPLPKHDTFPSWVGKVETAIAWASFTMNVPEVLAGWLAFRTATDLVSRRSESVNPEQIYQAVQKRIAPLELPPQDPLMAKLMDRAPINILLFGVGLNIIVGAGGGMLTRYAAWHMVCATDRNTPTVAVIREIASGTESWTCLGHAPLVPVIAAE